MIASHRFLNIPVDAKDAVHATISSPGMGFMMDAKHPAHVSAVKIDLTENWRATAPPPN
jgi:hypothetical protein